MLKKLSSKVQDQLRKGGVGAFKGVDPKDLKKLPSSLYAHIGVRTSARKGTLLGWGGTRGGGGEYEIRALCSFVQPMNPI